MKDNKNIEKAIYNQIEVNDKVLDGAMAEMKVNKNTQSQKRKRFFNFKILVPTALCLILCAIIVPVSINIVAYNNNKLKNNFVLADLKCTTMQSVAYYNDEHNTSYLVPAQLDGSCKLYSNDDIDIAITLSFIYANVECEWNIITNSTYSIEEFENYNNFTNNLTISDIYVYYSIVDEKACYLYFDCENSRYYVSAETSDMTILEKLIKTAI